MMIDIDRIKVGSRVRKDMGDLDALARSIADIGLLHPIVVTDDLELVCGERRLRACRDALGLAEIKVSFVDIDAMTFGERDENEIRKDFTVSERVEIGRRIEEKLEERRGRSSENRDRGPYLGRTRDIVAERAGFGSGRTYERAKAVVDHGDGSLTEAVDRGQVSIKAAEKVARSRNPRPPADKPKRPPRKPKAPTNVVPDRITQLKMWLRTGTWRASDFASGEDAAAQAVEFDTPLDVDSLIKVQSFVAGMLSAAGAVRAA